MSPDPPVCCSHSRISIKKSSLIYFRDDGGFEGHLSLALLSDPSGGMADKYDCYDEEEGMCRSAVVIIDNKSVVRHVMATDMDMREAGIIEFFKLT